MSNLGNTTNGVNTFLISVAKMRDLTRKDYKSFISEKLSDEDLSRIVTTRVWSPIVYKTEHRTKANFQSSQIIAIDCDNGEIPLAKMIDMIQDWGAWGVIGTTRNHQKWKDKNPPCDRFRAVFKMSAAVTDREQYEYNFVTWVKKLKGDGAVKDAARYYFPCQDIVFEQYGEPMDFLELPHGYVREAERQAKTRVRVQKHRDEQTIPPWVIRYVNDGPPEGRHNISYAIGAALAELGYEVDEIVDYVMSGPISQIGEADVRRAVENGWGKINGAVAAAGGGGTDKSPSP